MPQVPYKMYATASQDAAATIDIAEDGIIEGVMMAMNFTGADVLNDGGRMEISFASTSGFTSNDTRASICGVDAYQGVITTGGGQVGANVYAPMAIPVSAGERMYMHTLNNGTVTGRYIAWLYVNQASAGGRANIRRRQA